MLTLFTFKCEDDVVQCAFAYITDFSLWWALHVLIYIKKASMKKIQQTHLSVDEDGGPVQTECVKCMPQMTSLHLVFPLMAQ